MAGEERFQLPDHEGRDAAVGASAPKALTKPLLIASLHEALRRTRGGAASVELTGRRG